ncbi:TerB family tellurite resistance protein [bacterium]|nr:TerB family tellurite resistance protein [bacterium]
MGWFGLIAGALVGSLFGGGGSLIGGLIGNFAEEAIRGRKSKTDASREELYFLSALSAMLAKMAKADGRVSQSEINYVRNLFVNSGFSGEKYEYCIRIFRKAKDDVHSIYDYAADFAAHSPNREIRETLYGILWDLACADGSLSREELKILKELPPYLRISSARFNFEYRRRGGYSGSSSGSFKNGETQADPYAVLGKDRSASNEELKAAYREKAKKLHPDILRSQGLSEELLQKANEQMSILNEAWDAIRKERGI